MSVFRRNANATSSAPADPRSAKPALTIVNALDDERLFKPWFRGDSWNNWRAILKAAYALPMSPAEVEFFRSVAGGREPPRSQVRELWLICGRRAGKDSIASVIAAHSAALFDQQDRLRQGERALIACLAVDRNQSRIILDYIKSYFVDIPMLASLVKRSTAIGFQLHNSIDIEVSTNSFRSIRGRPFALAILDECAYYMSENSATPDLELYKAIVPGMATLPNSMLVGISSPYRRSGLLFQKHKDHFGRDGDVLVIQAPTTLLNPTIDPAIVARALEADPAAARSEWLAEFRADISGYLDLEVIEASVDRGVVVRPPVRGITYRSGADPSGGSRDSFTAAIAHDEDGLAVLDCLVEIKAPFNPTSATEQIAQTLKSYGITETVGDKYAAEWVVDAFAKCGITYQHSERDRSKIYADALPIFMSGRARLLDNPRLVNQFASLERRTSPIGRDRIDHGPAGMDDLANSAALAMVLAASPEPDYGLIDITREVWGRPAPIDDADENYHAMVEAYERRELKGHHLVGFLREREKREGRLRPTKEI
jgi:hypothetical protein